jgi:transcriptional regulator with XRE-family HTH domain
MLTKNMKMTLGDQLRKLRDESDLSLRGLAKQLGGVTAAHLSDIEFGRRYPSDELLKKLAVFFKVDEAELRALDTRPPVEEIKRLALSDPAFGLALRKLVDKEITPEDVLKMTEGKSDRPKNQ